MLGITNYDEYSLVRDIGEEKKEETTGTLKRDKTLLRDDKKMEKLKQKLHTDDECMPQTHSLSLSATHTHFMAFSLTVVKLQRANNDLVLLKVMSLSVELCISTCDSQLAHTSGQYEVNIYIYIFKYVPMLVWFDTYIHLNVDQI